MHPLRGYRETAAKASMADSTALKPRNRAFSVWPKQPLSVFYSSWNYSGFGKVFSKLKNMTTFESYSQSLLFSKNLFLSIGPAPFCSQSTLGDPTNVTQPVFAERSPQAGSGLDAIASSRLPLARGKSASFHDAVKSLLLLRGLWGGSFWHKRVGRLS